MSDNSERAVRAQQLLDDEVLQEALAAIEKFAVEQCLSAAAFDPPSCISAICHLQEAYRVRLRLQEFINTGKIEDRRRLSVA